MLRTIVFSVLSIAIHGNAHSEAPDCAQLAKDFDTSNKSLAAIAHNMETPLQPRDETLVQLKLLNIRIQQSMLLDVMITKGCELPSQMSSQFVYGDHAWGCEVAKKGADAFAQETGIGIEECDINTWVFNEQESKK